MKCKARRDVAADHNGLCLRFAAEGISSFGGCIVQYKHRSPLDAVATEKERINRNPAGIEV